jgi:hypothetical protein
MRAGRDSCVVHGTALKGFENFVFCPECDKELEKDVRPEELSEEEVDTIDDAIPFLDLDEDTLDLVLKSLDSNTYGYVVSNHEIKLGVTTLSPSDNLYLSKPDLGNTVAFVYKVSMDDIEHNVTSDGKMAYPTGIHQGVVLEKV